MINIMRTFATLALFIVVACKPQSAQSELPQKQVFLTNPDGTVQIELLVEVANTPQSRGQGLMFRKTMPASAGMLFVWKSSYPVVMWMKNTYLPLDMLFIQDDTVQGIIQHTVPLSEEDLTIHQPVDKVLEVNAGFVQQHGIQTGWKLLYSK